MTKGFRYSFGSSWADRAEKQADDLHSLKGHRGYLALTDMLEGDLRACWMRWIDPDLDGMEVDRVRQEAMLITKILVNLEQMTSEKDLQEMQVRAYEGFTTDEEIQAAHGAALAQAGQLPPTGGGVY